MHTDENLLYYIRMHNYNRNAYYTGKEFSSSHASLIPTTWSSIGLDHSKSYAPYIGHWKAYAGIYMYMYCSWSLTIINGNIKLCGIHSHTYIQVQLSMVRGKHTDCCMK